MVDRPDPGAAGRGMTSVSAPSPLRLAGFLGTVLGALGLGLGAVLTWITVPQPRGVGGSNLDVVYKGIDLTAGKVAIVTALVLLVGLMALRGAQGRRAQTVIAAAILLAAISGFVAALVTVFTADSRYGLADAPHVAIGTGLLLAAAGGVVGMLGGTLDLAWARAPILGSDGAAEAPPAGDEPSTPGGDRAS